MRKTLTALTLAVAGTLAIPSAFAQSADNGGWFVNGNVGRSSLDHGAYDGHDTAYEINGGYRWSLSPNAAIGIEAGYNDLGNIHVKNAFTDDPVLAKGQSQLHGWTTGVNGHFNVTPNWYVSARTGIYSWKGHGLSNNENPLRRSLGKTDYYGGLGVGHDFASNASVGINYDHFQAKKDSIDLSSNVLSISGEYRF